MTVAVDAPTRDELVEVAHGLQEAADAILFGLDPDVDPAAVLRHLRSVRRVFDAVDAGNTAQGKPPGALRPYRTWLYHLLADKRVPRDQIAEAAGVSTNAVGFDFKGQRRGRLPATNGNTPDPEPPARQRRPRPQ